MITKKAALNDASLNFTLYSPHKSCSEKIAPAWFWFLYLISTTTSNEKKVQFFETDETRENFWELKESYLKSKPREKITSVTSVIILLVLRITSIFQ